MGNQFALVSNNNNNRIHLLCGGTLHTSCFLLLGFDLNFVLQQGQMYSVVKKNNAQREHHFCPILYLRLLDIESGLNLIHNPLQVCAISQLHV